MVEKNFTSEFQTVLLCLVSRYAILSLGHLCVTFRKLLGLCPSLGVLKYHSGLLSRGLFGFLLFLSTRVLLSLGQEQSSLFCDVLRVLLGPQTARVPAPG